MLNDQAASPILMAWMETLTAYVRSDRPDLTNRQMAILLHVYLVPGPHTVRGLAAQLNVSKPVVTRALNTLGALGYVRRKKDSSDLRSVLVEQTPEGLAFIEDFDALIATIEGEPHARHTRTQDAQQRSRE